MNQEKTAEKKQEKGAHQDQHKSEHNKTDHNWGGAKPHMNDMSEKEAVEEEDRDNA